MMQEPSRKIQKTNGSVSHITKLKQVCAVLGSQWGDEGKGKIVDILCQEFDICARFNGGSNAGHTIVVGGKRYAFHLMPSGILSPKGKCLLGNGCVIHFPTLVEEMKMLKEQGVDLKDRLFISDRAHLVFDFHMEADKRGETNRGKGKEIGTTKKGIGPCYTDKMSRIGIRVGDLLNFTHFTEKFQKIVNAHRKMGIDVDEEAELKRYKEYADRLKENIVDGVFWINDQFKNGKKILLEGANAGMLDIDFGTYPYVTSSNPTVGGCVTGLGLSANKIGDVIGVVKAYTTRVGEGPFPTEQKNDIGKHLQTKGQEYGTTTGRERRCGWLDTVVLKYTHMLNGYTALNLTKLDILSGLETVKIGTAYKYNGEELDSMPESLEKLSNVEVKYETLPGWKEDISECTSFDQLPKNCQNYVRKIEELVGAPVKWIGVGAGRHSMIEKD